MDDPEAHRHEVNLAPAWQRGPAWRANRRILLIDSILRNIFVPKIYLRKLPANGLYDYEAVDDRRRLRSLWDCASPKSDWNKLYGFALKSGDTLPLIDGAAVDKEIVWIRHDPSQV